MDILVAVDPSTESRNALVNAIDIVSSTGGEVIAVHVKDEGTDGNDGDAESCLADAESVAAGRDVPIETVLLEGDPIEAIPDYARECGADAIYLGHRGLSREGEDFPGQSRGRLGSVARGIMERSVIPVTVFDRGL